MYKISIVIPVYNEGRHIADSLKIIQNCLEQDISRYEFILVDDGSTDNTWSVLTDLAAQQTGLRAVKLSRNFGKEAALCAGLAQADGEACITMDCDLQHPPELIPEMVRLWREEGYEVVEGVKSSRGREGVLNRTGSIIFYYMLYKLSGYNLNHASDFKLMDKKVLKAWCTLNEYSTFLRGMSAWLGFKRTAVSFEVTDRVAGRSKWSFFNLFKLAIHSIVSFSSLPLHLVTLLGILFLIGSFILGIQTLYGKIIGVAADGFTTVILLQLIIGSTLMISLGIIGTYIARIFDEVKRRPRYVVSEVFCSEENS